MIEATRKILAINPASMGVFSVAEDRDREKHIVT